MKLQSCGGASDAVQLILYHFVTHLKNVHSVYSEMILHTLTPLCQSRVDMEKRDSALSKYVAMGPQLQPLHLDQLR